MRSKYDAATPVVPMLNAGSYLNGLLAWMGSWSRRRKAPALLLCLCLLASCAAIKAKKLLAPKRDPFVAGEYAAATPNTGASLYQAGMGGFFEDRRARQVGDILIIQIDEAASAAQDASTELGRNGKVSGGVSAAGGLVPALQERFPNMDPATLLAYESASSFSGTGQVKRKGNVNATLPVQVRRVMPNGDLMFEGQKHIKVGSEENSIYIRGVVRAGDIRPDNSVLSSRIAAAEIEYTGKGDVSVQQRPGWLTRGLSRIWPF
jgi:flagellar L-ring protein FlgH